MTCPTLTVPKLEAETLLKALVFRTLLCAAPQLGSYDAARAGLLALLQRAQSGAAERFSGSTGRRGALRMGLCRQAGGAEAARAGQAGQLSTAGQRAAAAPCVHISGPGAALLQLSASASLLYFVLQS